jgi:hypothetical protein
VEYLLSLTALAIACLGGFGAVRRLTGPRYDPGLFIAAGSAMVLGAGIVSLSSFLLGFVLHGLPLRAGVAGLCAALLLAGFTGRRAPWTIERDTGTVAALVVIAAEVLFLSWLSLFRTSLSWDGLFVWESKARVAFLNQGVMPLDLFRVDFFHSMYPLLVPLMDTWIYGWLGQMDQTQVKLLGPFFAAAALLLLAGSARRLTNFRYAGAIAALSAAVVPAIVIGEGSASSGYADFPMAVVYLCCAVQILEYWRSANARALPLLGAAAMLLPWTKMEGIFLLGCIAVALLPQALRHRHWAGIAWSLAPGVALYCAWQLFLRALHTPDYGAMAITREALAMNLRRSGVILRGAAAEPANWHEWGVLWIMTPVCFLLARSARRFWYPYTSLVVLPAVIYSALFFFSTWRDLNAHIGSALSRLFLHSALVAVLLIVHSLSAPAQKERQAP